MMKERVAAVEAPTRARAFPAEAAVAGFSNFLRQCDRSRLGSSKKYVEKVGETLQEGPIGAGPTKFVSFIRRRAGLEASDQFCARTQREALGVQVIPDESTRLAR